MVPGLGIHMIDVCFDCITEQQDQAKHVLHQKQLNDPYRNWVSTRAHTHRLCLQGGCEDFDLLAD